MKKLVAIVGPTAIGKTSYAIELAKYFKTCIISADSRQFYTETTIGTAKPNEQQLQEVTHYFINHLSVTEHYDAGKFETEALQLLDELFQKHEVVVLCGGSGMYVDAVCKGFDAMPEADMEIRQHLNNIFLQYGIEALQKLLHQHDLVYYSQVDLNNPQRMIRALEVCLSTGKPYSSYKNRKKTERSFNVQYIGLEMEREKLYGQINNRVDLMMKEGLLDEVKQLYNYKDYNALKTVGYTELFDYLEGKINLEQAVALIKQHSRNFAKRQITWFKKNKDIVWLQPDAIEEAIKLIVSGKN